MKICVIWYASLCMKVFIVLSVWKHFSVTK
jgi:hypothetical protein